MPTPSSRTIAYLRVSTPDQDVEKNKLELLALANDKHLGHVEFVDEKATGSLPWRKRRIAEVLDTLKPQDALFKRERTSSLPIIPIFRSRCLR